MIGLLSYTGRLSSQNKRSKEAWNLKYSAFKRINGPKKQNRRPIYRFNRPKIKYFASKVESLIQNLDRPRIYKLQPATKAVHVMIFHWPI
jgi:hypothetical protein